MPRIRSIKPEFFSSLDVAALTVRARLTWIALWSWADDEGRAVDDARLLRAFAYPLDDEITVADVEADLELLALEGRIVRYTVGGRRYLESPTMRLHQKPNRPTPSKHPAPPLTEGSVSAHGVDSEGSLPERGGGERRGGGRSSARTADRSRRPTPFCSKHPEGTDAPCRACGDARRRSEEWKPPLARAPEVRREPDCPQHPSYPHPDSPHGCPRCIEEAAA